MELISSSFSCPSSWPELKYDFDEDLVGLCKEMGINTLFTSETDFSPMASEWLKVEAIIHKAHIIEVDRHDTKAVTVTMAYAVAGCAPSFDFKSVELDRPFVYAIADTEAGLPIFTGIYNHE